MHSLSICYIAITYIYYIVLTILLYLQLHTVTAIIIKLLVLLFND